LPRVPISVASAASVARCRFPRGILTCIKAGIRRATGIRAGISAAYVASLFPFIRAGFARAGITGIISGDFSEGYDGARIGALTSSLDASSHKQRQHLLDPPPQPPGTLGPCLVPNNGDAQRLGHAL
jgi:hypothetical protein